MHETTPTFFILAVGVSYAAAWLCSSLFSGPSSRVKSSRPRASSRTSEGDAAARQSVSDSWSDWLIESDSSSAQAKPGVVAQPPSTLQAGRVLKEASGHRGMALPKGLPPRTRGSSHSGGTWLVAQQSPFSKVGCGS
jgi:hypothetical protein